DAQAQGRHIGRYVLLRRLGSGAMGDVYAAYDPELDRNVALKLLRARRHTKAAASEGQQRLLREARAMAQLRAANVVAVHDAGVHDDQVYVAMELVEGRTLKDWLAVEPRGWREIMAVFILAGRGLAAAHAKDLVHRDFKPENVMVGADGRAQVMDFGLARTTVAGAGEAGERDDEGDHAETESGSSSLRLTRAGAIVGTPAYMAPEQWSGQMADARSDQFSYCVALWEALYGQRPFAGDNAAAIAFSVTAGTLREPRSPRRVPSWMRTILARGLEVSPERRWPSMLALLDAFEHAQLRRRRRKWLLGLACGAALLGGLASARTWDRQRRVSACEAEAATIGEVWNPEVAASLGARFVEVNGQSRAGLAETTVVKLRPWFDRWIEAWQRARTHSCLGATVEKTIAPALA
ncbi:MAG: serine/threonine protein kinase, partial [Myxococcales bacterium]|nr:serine/threonine protein kinase [Myxococcales bacterium]